MKQIVGFKTTAGADVLGYLESENDNELVITQARIVVSQPGQGGDIGIALPPWTILAIEGSVSVNKIAIACQFPSIADELARAYMQATSALDLSAIS